MVLRTVVLAANGQNGDAFRFETAANIRGLWGLCLKQGSEPGFTLRLDLKDVSLVVGMCQHDLRRLPHDVVPDLLASHRKIVLDGRLADSHCYRRTVADVETSLARQPQVDNQLHRPARHLDLMLSSISEAVFAHDREGHLVYANRAGRKLPMVPAYSAVFKEIESPCSARHRLRRRGWPALASWDLPRRAALRERRPSDLSAAPIPGSIGTAGGQSDAAV